MLVQILVEIYQKILIANIETFTISAANILPIRYIGTPLINSSGLNLQKSTSHSSFYTRRKRTKICQNL